VPASLSDPGSAGERVSRRAATEAFLAQTGRGSVAIHRSFVQGRDEYDQPRPGPLAALVGRGRRSTFDQYLLLLAWAGRGESSLCLNWRAWTTMLGLGEDDAARRTIARNWSILEELALVEIRRCGRETSATLLSGDGSGGRYEHPDYDLQAALDLPHAYWLEKANRRLTVPGKAVLLIALTLGDWFALPTRKGPQWYGLSRSTLERGFKSAYDAAVLGMRFSIKEAPAAPMGYTKENHYILLPPFGPRGRSSSTAPPNFTANWPRPDRVHRKRPRRRTRGGSRPG
jgi:hypothetical protein